MIGFLFGTGFWWYSIPYLFWGRPGILARGFSSHFLVRPLLKAPTSAASAYNTPPHGQRRTARTQSRPPVSSRSTRRSWTKNLKNYGGFRAYTSSRLDVGRGEHVLSLSTSEESSSRFCGISKYDDSGDNSGIEMLSERVLRHSADFRCRVFGFFTGFRV